MILGRETASAVFPVSLKTHVNMRPISQTSACRLGQKGHYLAYSPEMLRDYFLCEIVVIKDFHYVSILQDHLELAKPALLVYYLDVDVSCL